MATPSGQLRPILGQNADLGSLYNARTDSFIPLNLVVSDPPPQTVNYTRNQSSQIVLLGDDTLREKFAKFGLGDELAASFLAGMIPVSGSGYYLQSTRRTDEYVEGAILLEITTEQVTLNLHSLHETKSLSVEAFRCRDATHVVVGITSGVRIVIAARQPSQGDIVKSTKQLKSKLEDLSSYMRCKQMSTSLEPRNYRIKCEQPLDSLEGLSFAIFSDFQDRQRVLNSGIHEVISFIDDIPTLLASTNAGRGVNISCTLESVGIFQYVFGINRGQNSPITQLPPAILQKFVRTFDQCNRLERGIQDYSRNSQAAISRISSASRKEAADIESLLESSLNEVLALKSDYRRILPDVRSSLTSPRELTSIIRQYHAGEGSPKAVESILSQAKEILDFKMTILEHGGQYIDYDDAKKAVSIGSNIYIMYFARDMRDDISSWEANRQIIMRLLIRNPGDYLVAVAECQPRQLNFTKPRVVFYRRGAISSDDMLEQMDLVDQCFAKYDPAALDQSGCHQPVDRRLVRIPCLDKSCDHDTPRDWACYRCRGALEYCDDYIYCECGRAPARSFTWQCSSDNHGSDFSKFSTSQLDSALRALESYKDLNILLLGETGVGKSTFINAFYNYITFNDLDEAMAHEKLDFVIPSSFSMQYIDKSSPEGSFVQCDVKVGANENEHDGSRGDSATQKATVYRFPIGDRVVRLIDTPGIGDVRGTDVDAKNMTSILRTLNQFRTLHGIIILLKPNTARLTLMFRFCVKELLSSLHRDAARNVAWGFTNTRQSNYMPGDAYKPLERLLEQHKSLGLKLTPKTVFCFDSESFRCLAAKKQANIDLPNMEDFQRSWQRSVQENTRLLKHFSDIAPHQVKSTISLNRARELISQLTQPMASIADTIQRTIILNTDKISELSNAHCKGKDLEKSLHFERIEIEVLQLDYPRTVCKHASCVEMKLVGGVRRPLYNSVCHKRCRLKGVDEETVGHHAIMECRAFRTGKGTKRQVKCVECGHHWQEHMHIRYSQTEKVIPDVDPNVQKEMEANASEIQLKKAAIQALKAQIREANGELEQIRDAAIRFGLFLKRNSIVPYNDAMIAYLDEMIKEERQYVEHAKTHSIQAEKNEERLANLQKAKKSYAERIKLLEEHMNISDNAEMLDEQGVDDLANKLYELKSWGKNLQTLREILDWSKTNDFCEQQYRPKANRMWQALGWIADTATNATKAIKTGFSNSQRGPDTRSRPREHTYFRGRKRSRSRSRMGESSQPGGIMARGRVKRQLNSRTYDFRPRSYPDHHYH